MIDYTSTERVAIPGDVDFTMMYAAHDAFTRHVQRVVAAVEAGRGGDPVTAARWDMFAHQLDIHHTAEDDLLWPALEAAVQHPDEVGVLQSMEREHASIDPLIDEIRAGFAASDFEVVGNALRQLQAGLGAHMRHEENTALPLVAAYLGRAGWAAFTGGIRKRQGVSGAAVYLPWLLDGATAKTTATVLRVLPAPARLIYRARWLPKYRRRVR